MPAFAVAFLLLSDLLKGVVVLVAIALSCIVIMIELGRVYHSGVSL